LVVDRLARRGDESSEQAGEDLILSRRQRFGVATTAVGERPERGVEPQPAGRQYRRLDRVDREPDPGAAQDDDQRLDVRVVQRGDQRAVKTIDKLTQLLGGAGSGYTGRGIQCGARDRNARLPGQGHQQRALAREQFHLQPVDPGLAGFVVDLDLDVVVVRACGAHRQRASIVVCAEPVRRTRDPAGNEWRRACPHWEARTGAEHNLLEAFRCAVAGRPHRDEQVRLGERPIGCSHQRRDRPDR
jgi:hypothetical protein